MSSRPARHWDSAIPKYEVVAARGKSVILAEAEGRSKAHSSRSSPADKAGTQWESYASVVRHSGGNGTPEEAASACRSSVEAPSTGISSGSMEECGKGDEAWDAGGAVGGVEEEGARDRKGMEELEGSNNGYT